MKLVLILIASVIAMDANAHGLARGPSGAPSGQQMGGARAGLSAAYGGGTTAGMGNGGRVYAENAYQPWPQEEMQQFAKSRWTPWDGKD